MQCKLQDQQSRFYKMEQYKECILQSLMQHIHLYIYRQQYLKYKVHSKKGKLLNHKKSIQLSKVYMCKFHQKKLNTLLMSNHKLNKKYLKQEAMCMIYSNQDLIHNILCMQYRIIGMFHFIHNIQLYNYTYFLKEP